MHPEPMSIRNRLLQLRIIFAESLREAFFPWKFFLVGTPAPHPEEVIRRGKQKKDRKKNIIKPADDSIHASYSGLIFNFRLAERGGFEPPVGFKPTHAFQACALNHSAISPSRRFILRQFLAIRNFFPRRGDSIRGEEDPFAFGFE